MMLFSGVFSSPRGPLAKAAWIGFIVLAGILALSCNSGPSPEEAANDNRLLALALAQPSDQDRYHVVIPDTSLLLEDDSGAALDRLHDQIQGYVQGGGADVKSLLKRLLKRNKYSSRLTLMSSKDNGYVVDYNADFFPFFQGNEGDWKRMYALYPKVVGVKQVSLPAYEKGHDIVLIYVCRRTMPASGSGYIYVYRDNGTSLTPLGSVQTWSP